MLNTIRTAVSGKKVYILIGIGALASVFQFLTGVNLGMPDLPPADTIPALINQLWVFATGAAVRAAIAK